MLSFNAWDVAIIAGASFIAVTALVRMMRWRRDRLMKSLQAEFDQEQQRNHRARRLQKKREEAA